ncbi:glycosyltransferase family 4 protein [Flavobacterium sp. GB2R13]|uniref:glycosyltransferase family 4 protein n=1 Tax=Flavobacterium algoris TaxID=3398733 RepID=UPI003A8A031E
MKILRFCLKTPPIKGGMEAHIYHLTNEQINDEHDVTVVFNAGEKVSVQDIKISRIKWFAIKPQFIGVLMFGAISIFDLLIKNKKFDIVHVHGDWSAIFIGRLIVLFGIAKKDALTFHGGIQNNFSHQKLLPFFLKKVFVTFATGYESYQFLKKYNSNTHFQPSGVNPFFFETRNKKKEDKKYDVVSVANFFPVKNQKFILEIAEILKEYSFILVGDGPTQLDVETMIKKRNLSNVSCVGFKDYEAIAVLMFESKVFLLTSLEEGTPTSMMEAITMGLPIVISDVGGISNFIGEANGSVQKEFNPELYSEKIRELIEDNTMYNTMKENNFIFSARFEWSSVAKFITSKYE